MTTLSRTAVVAALLALLAAPSAAQVLDKGRFVVYQNETPVGTERFAYEHVGDSVIVESVVARRVRGSDGSEVDYKKTMALVTNTFDSGLVRYLSNEDFDGRKVVRGILPGDTTLTYYEEGDLGDASTLVRPPGRLFVLDALMFTLFDVMCRSVHDKVFEHRPMQLITLSKSGAGFPVADVERGGLDTLRWCGRRTIARRYSMHEPSGDFVAWMNSKGQMIRLVHEKSGLRVERDAPPIVPAKRRAKA